MATKKNGPIKDKEKTDLSSSDQKRVNKEWESLNRKKLPKGENAAISDAAYKEWKSTGKLNHTYYNPKDKPKKEEVTATLKTKKLTQTPVDKSVKRVSTPSTKKEEKPKYTPEAGAKKLTKGGGRTGNVATAAKNVVGKQVFKSEQKASDSYNRATSTSGTGSQAGMSKIERRNELKTQLKDLKSDRKYVKKSTGVDVKSDIKDTRKAIKWSDKVGSNKNRYLTISGRKK